jgi:hypothetical protein
MRNLLSGFLAVTMLGAVCGIPSGSAGGTKKEVVNSFKCSIVSKMTLEVEGKRHPMDADTEFRYTWRRSGQEKTLTFDAMAVKVRMDGAPRLDIFMSRDKSVKTDKGKTEETPFDKLPEQAREQLQATFGVPAYKLQLDENGKAVKETVLAGPRSLVNRGIIANGLIFHPPYMGDRNEWQADTELNTGPGGIVRGKLTYQKVGTGPVFKVSGTITEKNIKLPDQPLTVKECRYVISGEQTYDPGQQEWISGKLIIDLSMTLVSDKAESTGKGTMELRLEKLPGK